MPAIVKELQLGNSYNRKSIIDIILAETHALPVDCVVSVLDTGDGGIWDLVI
jgi:hypothetical protein